MAITTDGLVVSSMHDALKQLNPVEKTILIDDVAREWVQETGIQNVALIDVMSTDAALTANTAGWFGGTSLTVTQKSITLGDLKSEMSVFYRTLEKKVFGCDISVYEKFAENVFLNPLYQEKAQLLWTGSGTNNQPTGLIVALKADATRTLGSTTYSGATGYAFSVSDIDEAFAAYVAAIPLNISGKKLKMYVSLKTFNLWIANRVAANIFDPRQMQVTPMSYRMPILLGGQEIELVGTVGLGTSNYMVMTYTDNLMNLSGCPENDKVEFEYFMPEQTYLWRFVTKFSAGFYNGVDVVTNF